MSNLAQALLDALDDEALAALAERLQPYLASDAPAPDAGWLRGAERIAAYIDSPASRVYALASAGRIPVRRDGSALVAQRIELDDWLQNGGGKRP